MCLHLRKVKDADKSVIYQHIDTVKIEAKRVKRPQLPEAAFTRLKAREQENIVSTISL